MQRDRPVCFPPFRLEPRNARLWRDDAPLPLQPKAFAVLQHLVERAGQLVTRDELLSALWPTTHVSDAVLTVCVREIRKALDDPSRAPRFIETVHTRGYRFIGSILPETPPAVAQPADEPAAILIGRQAPLARLEGFLHDALGGRRQLVFVTGDVGIGKTTLVDAFVQRMLARADLRVATGQCVEHYGAGEPYLPFLDALGRLCRGNDGEALVAILHRHAPTWLAQMPSLLDAADRERLQRELLASTGERMLRELAEALEALATDRPLVLTLEDMHWSDHSTLQLLSFLARRREPARLLLLSIYRPVDAIVARHPLRTIKRELQIHGQCEEIALDLLSTEEIGSYLETRFAGVPCPPALRRAFHRQTAGNPLFLVNMADYVESRGWIGDGHWRVPDDPTEIELGVPETLRDIIAHRIEMLDTDERRLLEGASVVGMAFTSALVASATEEAPSHVEGVCDGLVHRGQLLRSLGAGSWLDQPVVAHYAFTHALYQSVLYDAVPEARRARLHLRIACRLEQAYGSGATDLAAELADHFERAHELDRAVTYLQSAAEHAAQRHANRETTAHLRKALALLEGLPASRERAERELTLRTMLGPMLIAAQGNAAPEVAATYTRARTLCEQLEASAQLFPVLFGLRSLHLIRGQIETAHALGEDLLRTAEDLGEPDLLLEARVALASTFFFLGEFEACRAQVQHGLDLYAREHHAHVVLYGLDPGVFCLCRLGQVLWLVGRVDGALARIDEALCLARELKHPYSLGFALNNAAWVHQFRGEPEAARRCAEEAIALADEHALVFLRRWARIQRGRARCDLGEKDGLVEMRAALEDGGGSAGGGPRSYLLTSFAEACGVLGRASEGLAVVEEAIEDGGERFLDAERQRLRGDLLLASVRGRPSSRRLGEAEACYARAIEIACAQHAPSLELRAVTSLARLWRTQGRAERAVALLREALGRFTEGADTADLRQASSLLRELGGRRPSTARRSGRRGA